MKNGLFTAPLEEVEYQSVYNIVLKFFPNIQQSCVDIQCFHDYSEDIERTYSVYCINLKDKDLKYVLKKTTLEEVTLYENYLSNHDFQVPKFYHALEDHTHYWILTEFIPGTDGKYFTEEIAIKLAKSLTTILNFYWIEEGVEGAVDSTRFKHYWNRINARKQCLHNYPHLAKAYDLFVERQKTCPISLCNGDLMQINMICNENGVYIIDWAFGGFLPYALEIARVIAHGSDSGFVFYMTDDLREVFITEVYQNLKHTPLSFEDFCYDIKLARLNEHIEFLEYNLNHPDEPTDDYFKLDFMRAHQLAHEILSIHRRKLRVS